MEGGHRQKVRNTANQLVSAQNIAHILTHRFLDHFHPIHKTSQHLDWRVLLQHCSSKKVRGVGKTAGRELCPPRNPPLTSFPGECQGGHFLHLKQRPVILDVSRSMGQTQRTGPLGEEGVGRLITLFPPTSLVMHLQRRPHYHRTRTSNKDKGLLDSSLEHSFSGNSSSYMRARCGDLATLAPCPSTEKLRRSGHIQLVLDGHSYMEL